MGERDYSDWTSQPYCERYYIALYHINVELEKEGCAIALYRGREDSHPT